MSSGLESVLDLNRFFSLEGSSRAIKLEHERAAENAAKRAVCVRGPSRPLQGIEFCFDQSCRKQVRSRKQPCNKSANHCSPYAYCCRLGCSPSLCQPLPHRVLQEFVGFKPRVSIDDEALGQKVRRFCGQAFRKCWWLRQGKMAPKQCVGCVLDKVIVTQNPVHAAVHELIQ